MDILAHGLWTNAIFESSARLKNQKRSRRDIWLGILFGIAPDLLSFGIFFVQNIFRVIFFSEESPFQGGPPDPNLIPDYISTLYNFTHSFIIFAAVFGLIWLIRRKPYWLMAGWGIHIIIDIFSHSKDFFPTPFLFPVSDFTINGTSWGHSTFMLINYSALILVYAYFFISRKRNAKKN